MIGIIGRWSFRSKGIYHRNREGERGILRNIYALYCLDHVDAGAPLVGSGEGNGFLVDVVRSVVEFIGRSVIGERMLRIHLDEHLHLIFNEHRVDDGRVDLPFEAFRGLWLGEGKVVASGTVQGLTVSAHDTDRDENLARPVIVIAERHCVTRIVIARDYEIDFVRFGPVAGKKVFPILADGELLDGFVWDRVDLVSKCFVVLLLVILARIYPVQVRCRVGNEAAVETDILPYCFRKLTPGTEFRLFFIGKALGKIICGKACLGGIVLDVGYIVERGLAGITCEGHGVDYAVQQSVEGGEIPLDFTVNELRTRRLFIIEGVSLGPLVLEITVGYGAVHFNGVACGPGNRLAIVADGVGNGFAGNKVNTLELVVHNGDREPVFVGRFVDFEKLDGFRTNFYLIGGAILDFDRGHAQGLDDGREDRLDRRIQRISIGGIKVVCRLSDSVAKGIGSIIIAAVRNVCDAARRPVHGHRPVRACRPRFIGRVGIVNQIVQQVGFCAVRINTKESSVCTLLNSKGII